ncbi:MAG: tetratricopeptide repeat protein [Bacteroides sp.]|jgi:hypothetical protein
MSKSARTDEQLNGVESIENALTHTEQYLEKNRKGFLFGVVILVVVVVGYIAYSNLYAKPKEAEAQKQVYFAELQFGKDSFNVALNGDGNNLGFLQIMEDFSGTKIANLSRFYAGVCYRELGDFDKAIALLDSYSLEDDMIAPVALGTLGDCYVEKGDVEKGLSFYSKAISYRSNTLAVPIFLLRRGLLYEANAKKTEALADYQMIKDLYPKSPQALEIDKFIERVKIQ